MNEDLLSGFKFFLLQQPVPPAESTISSYCQRFQFLKKNVPELSFSSITKFIMECKQRGYKNSSLNKIVSAAKLWGKYTGQLELTRIKFFREDPAAKNILSNDEITAFLSLPPTRYKDLYNLWTFFWSIGFYCGLRLAEISRLKCEDFDFARNVIRVNSQERGKTGFRQVPIPHKLLDECMQRCNNKKGHIFISPKGNLFNDVIWNYNWHTRLKRLGITKDVKPYSVRDSKITRLLEGDVNLLKVMKFAGHKNPKTTMRYEHLVVKDLVEANRRDELITHNLSPQETFKSILDQIKALRIDTYKGISYKIREENRKLVLELGLSEDLLDSKIE